MSISGIAKTLSSIQVESTTAIQIVQIVFDKMIIMLVIVMVTMITLSLIYRGSFLSLTNRIKDFFKKKKKWPR